MLPNKIPNLAQREFIGVYNFEFIIPRIKKSKEIQSDQILICPEFNRGHKAIIKKTTKKTNPKLRFELIFILGFFDIIFLL